VLSSLIRTRPKPGGPPSARGGYRDQKGKSAGGGMAHEGKLEQF